MRKTLEEEEYNRIVEKLKKKEKTLLEIAKEEKVNYNTLLCISSQLEQFKTKANFYVHRRPFLMLKYFQLYKEKQFSICQLSDQVQLAPSLMARLILHCYFSFQTSSPSLFPPTHNHLQLSQAFPTKQSDSLIPKQLKNSNKEQIEVNSEQQIEVNNKQQIEVNNNEQIEVNSEQQIEVNNKEQEREEDNKMIREWNNKKVVERVKEGMKDVSRIEDPELREQVRQAIKGDAFYSTMVEKVKEREGLEFEYKLQQKLINLKIAFLQETNLRQLGFSKTPDVRLVVPLLIKGKVVNWIESKASFGDYATHQQYLHSQFWGYYHRFGPGLIIYWYGFVEELISLSPLSFSSTFKSSSMSSTSNFSTSDTSSDYFLIMDHFPLSFTSL